MASLQSRCLGIVIKSLAGLQCTRAARCISLPNALSTIQCMTARWCSESTDIFNPQKPPSLSDLPKRPTGAFVRFSIEQRPKVTAQHPEWSFSKIGKTVAEQWRALSDAEKQVYKDAFTCEVLKYREILKKYKDRFDPLDLKLLKNIMLKKLEEKRRIRLRKELKASGLPKLWQNGFQIFFSEHIHQCQEDSFYGKNIEMIAKWRALPGAEKEVYKKLAEVNRIRYINERKAWEERMKEIGREDLIELSKQRRNVSADKGPMGNGKKEPTTQSNTQPRKQRKSKKS